MPWFPGNQDVKPQVAPSGLELAEFHQVELWDVSGMFRSEEFGGGSMPVAV